MRASEFGGAGHEHAVRVALDDVRAHFNQAIHEVHAAFEHFFEKQDRALGL